ncbi:MAG TPA: threonine/serine dehydratase [Mycobacteriales bacterium]
MTGCATGPDLARTGIDRGDVEAAADRVGWRVRRTPTVVVDAAPFGHPVALKLELLQHTGSFKPRGVLNRLLAADLEPGSRVIAASGGNAGLAVAYAARELGLRADIVVPVSCPAVKVDRLRALGASVTRAGAFYPDAYAVAAGTAQRTGTPLVHAYDQAEVCAGQGTLALELIEQAGPVDTVLVAVGGGGLVAGIAAALEDRVRVVGVEPEGCPTLHAALAAGRPVDVPVGGIAADSLGAGRIGEVCWAVARRTGLRSVLVPDEAIARVRRRLWDELRVLAEYGGATALAPLITGAYLPERGERVAAVVCGGNTDPAGVLTDPPARRPIDPPAGRPIDMT